MGMESLSIKPPTESARGVILGILGSNLFALFMGGIYEYLSLRGVTSMMAAWIVLLFVWIIGVVGIVLSEWIWGGSIKQRIFSGVVAASALGAALFALDIVVDRYSASAQPAPAPSNTSGNCNAVGQNNTVNCNNPPLSISPTSANGSNPPTKASPIDSTISEAEKNRRNKILEQLSQEYAKNGVACANPFDQWYANKWANNRLKEIGETWQLPLPTILHETFSDNYMYGPCNSIDVKAKNAEVQRNNMFGPRNSIKVDSDKAKVDQNNMGTK